MKFKYHNRPTIIDNIRFDSAKEARRYSELKILLRAGEITNLRLQVPYELIPSQTGGLRKERPLTYIADFVYMQNGTEIIEDVKGVRTDSYKIKRKMMKLLGKEITET